MSGTGWFDDTANKVDAPEVRRKTANPCRHIDQAV